MILTILARAAFPVLDIVGPQTPPPPPPPPQPAPVVVMVADNRPLAAPGKVTDGPVPCNQSIADGTVYCGTPGEAAPVTVVVDWGDGPAETSSAWARPFDAEYDGRLNAGLCAARPEFCAGEVYSAVQW